MTKHEFVRPVLESSEALGVLREEGINGAVGMSGEDVLGLKSGGQTWKVQDRVKDLQGCVLRDEGGQ